MWFSTPDERGWGAMLGFRRLAILDLSTAGDQPMVDPVTGHAIAFNGEIYNFKELRQRLEAEGQHFLSTGDTAVMLRALGLHGPTAVSWLRGMFAFACWNPKQRRLLLAQGCARHQASLPGPIIEIRAQAGPWRSLRSFAHCWPPACLEHRTSTRRPSPAACGMASWSVLVPSSKVSNSFGLAGCSNSTVREGRSANEDFWRIPDHAPIRLWTRTDYPKSWRRG